MFTKVQLKTQFLGHSRPPKAQEPHVQVAMPYCKTNISMTAESSYQSNTALKGRQASSSTSVTNSSSQRTNGAHQVTQPVDPD